MDGNGGGGEGLGGGEGFGGGGEGLGGGGDGEHSGHVLQFTKFVHLYAHGFVLPAHQALQIEVAAGSQTSSKESLIHVKRVALVFIMSVSTVTNSTSVIHTERKTRPRVTRVSRESLVSVASENGSSRAAQQCN